MKARNLVIALLGVAIAFVVLFSAIFVSLETFHSCDGDNCPICEMLQLCEKTINQLSDGHIAVSFFAHLIFLLIAGVILPRDIFTRSTPVTEMVRMND
ncbi:hypothetical protein [Butyrivibrio sp. AC2005]|jgi:hypothetical protein|uniref:hypothetical protein n=1 Tax=Butyrivibrio sp. AC2005 TaxID=1280672 RepID=UPI0003FC7DAC|nr:hypothetical protein [Butyrivibrio sp. AC2005]